MTITKGNVSVHVYHTPTTVRGKKYASWTLTWIDPKQGRLSKRYTVQAKAVTAAKKKADLLDRGQIVSVTGAEAASYNLSVDHLQGTGVPLDRAAQEYAAAIKETGVSLPELAQFWKERHSHNGTVTAKQVADEMLAAKRQDGVSGPYLHDLEVRTGVFVASFGGPLADITKPAIDDWLRAMEVGKRSRKNYARAVVTLFNFAKDRGYLPGNWNELPSIPAAMAELADIQIYAPEELAKLLAAAENPKSRIRYDIVPLLLLGAFAGIRTAEICRMDWKDVGEDYIVVKSKRTRTAARRVVPVHPALKDWFRSIRKPAGPVVLHKRVSDVFSNLSRLAGVPWKHNALRHSYISYRVAEIEDVQKVALECGNSPAMIFQSYRALVTREQASAWFNLSRKSVATLLDTPGKQS